MRGFSVASVVLGYFLVGGGLFVGLAVNASLTSLVRKPAGVCYHDPDLLALARSGFQEGAAVAKALGESVSMIATRGSGKPARVARSSTIE